MGVAPWADTGTLILARNHPISARASVLPRCTGADLVSGDGTAARTRVAVAVAAGARIPGLDGNMDLGGGVEDMEVDDFV